MKFNQKIQSLLQSGKISTEQAEALSRSIGGSASIAEASSFHSAITSDKVMIGLGAAIVGIITWYLLAQSGGADTQTIQNVSETLNQVGKVGEMNKSLATFMSIAIFAIPALLLIVFGYNRLVDKEEDVLASWAQVETTYQRRADLIPNLVSTVKTYMEHEKNTMGSVTALREHIKQLEDRATETENLTKGAVNKLDNQTYLDQFKEAQDSVSASAKALMLEVENYPDLKASDQFLELQAQLEGTENRIATARMVFNEKVNDFNASIRRLPGSLIAGIGGFTRKAYFKSESGAENAVKVEMGE